MRVSSAAMPQLSTTLAAVAVCAACGAPVRSADDAPAPAPTGAIPALDPLLGRWQIDARDPGTGRTFALRYEVVPVLAGRWYQGTGRSDELDLDIHDVWGLDPVSGEVVRTMFDSGGTHAVVRSAGWRDDVLILVGEAAVAGARVEVRETLTRRGPDELEAVWEARQDGVWTAYSVETLRRQP